MGGKHGALTIMYSLNVIQGCYNVVSVCLVGIWVSSRHDILWDI
jgi:hypothetical protein